MLNTHLIFPWKAVARQRHSFLRTYKNTMIWRAHIIGAHLRKCKELDIDLIQKNLQDLWQGKVLFSKLTPAEEKLINKVHWNIYFGA